MSGLANQNSMALALINSQILSKQTLKYNMEDHRVESSRLRVGLTNRSAQHRMMMLGGLRICALNDELRGIYKLHENLMLMLFRYQE